MIRLIEKLGLDWIPILFGISLVAEAPLPYPTTLPEVRSKLGDLKDEAKLNDAIDYCASLLKNEESRADKIESKAFTLIGITGIAAGLITGFAGLLLDSVKIPSVFVLIFATTFYLLVVVSLMLTISLAVKVVIISDYRFTYPSANDIFQLSDASLRYVKHERAASLFYSFAQNVRVINRKATYLAGAQLWFRNSIILLLFLTLVLAAYIPFKALGSAATIVGPTSVPISTDTPQPLSTPTLTSTSLPTATPTFTPTYTPTSTTTHTATHTPTPTATHTRTQTPVPTPTATVQPRATVRIVPNP